MKSTLTPKQLELCRSLVRYAKEGAEAAPSDFAREYYLGKRYGIVDAVSVITGESWVKTEQLLRSSPVSP